MRMVRRIIFFLMSLLFSLALFLSALGSADLGM
jgi:hypothetical protein